MPSSVSALTSPDVPVPVSLEALFASLIQNDLFDVGADLATPPILTILAPPTLRIDAGIHPRDSRSIAMNSTLRLARADLIRSAWRHGAGCNTSSRGTDSCAAR